MNPHAEEVEYLRIFGWQLHLFILSFYEASIESSIEVNGVEAKDAFEDIECTQ